MKREQEDMKRQDELKKLLEAEELKKQEEKEKRKQKEIQDREKEEKPRKIAIEKNKFANPSEYMTQDSSQVAK